MMRVITVAALLALVGANRIQQHAKGAKEDSVAQNSFFESCDDFHTIFRSRMAAVQSLLAAHPNATGMNAMNRARFTMRTFGVVRTLRRAQDCPWVVDGESKDIDEAQSIVQTTLAGNPCAAAAMAELTPEAYESATNELIPLQRAMLVLVSDTCVVPVFEPEELEDDAVDDRMAESEEQVQNNIDELFEEAALDSENGVGGSLMQTEGVLATMFAWVGAIFFAIVLGLACALPGMVMGMVFAAMLGVLYCSGRSGPCQEGLGFIVLGGFGGAALGFANCAAIPLLAMVEQDSSRVLH